MSSEHDVRVVRVGRIEPHPDADRLEITEVDGRPVVTGRGVYREGDLAVYVPVDSLVDTRPGGPFDFLATRAKTDGTYRIRAMRLRGVFSMGLLTPPPPGVSEGDDVAELMGITQWEPPEEKQLNVSAEDGPAPSVPFPLYTDVESHRKYHKVFAPDELVVATEKIHGCNARYVWADGRIYAGSRKRVKKADGDTVWHQAITEEMERFLRDHPGVVLYGEVYGQVQDLRYGVESGVRFAGFDLWADGAFLPWKLVQPLLEEYGIPVVPELYRGPAAGLESSLANGPSVQAHGACIREGIVIRPLVAERHDRRLGRVITKLVGEDYLTR